MVETYLKVIDAIRSGCKWANWLDWEKGQLDEPERFNSIVTPGVLVDPSAIEWEELGKSHQLGFGPLTVKLVTMLPAQTYALDPTVSENAKAQEMADKLHGTLIKTPGIIRRTGNARPYWVSTFFVIEQTYEFRYTFDPCIPTAPLPAPQITATVTVPI
ncbi:hypothetical protein ACO2Q8_07845 [Larkinella sp. VNQ87]|uniref:hypothetical protein n=1 Tax=Larkinella sp. VNQ87 TaxID=3400921 RepID=UPI003C035D2F